MTNKSNLTIANISKTIGVAESTLRFYRDKFDHYIPYVGEGRKRRYEAQAIDIFKEIADLSSQGVPISDIEQHLSERYPHNPIIVLDDYTTAKTAMKTPSAVTATQPQETENSVISVIPDTAVTAVTTQNAITAMEPQYILTLQNLIKAAQQNEPKKMYCTAKEAAIRTGFSQDFIRKCCREYLETRKGIPCARTGRGYVIHKGMLDEWFTKVITLGGYGS